MTMPPATTPVATGLVECVPNVSEGRDPRVLEALAEAITSVPGVGLLHVDANPDANRTVFTFVARPEAALEAAYRLVNSARALIDMRNHHGVHPRLGAVCVCPFVPLAGTDLPECVSLSQKLGQRLGDEGLPVYLYAAAARTPERRSLAYLRKGEYESLPQKLGTLPPDYGPAVFTQNIARSGATVVGARDFLVAYNVNLRSKDLAVAQSIAAAIRQNGQGQKLPGVRAIGWWMERYDCTQVSMNLTDLRAAGLFAVWTACEIEAKARAVALSGSELIGLAPLFALKEAGDRFLGTANESDSATVTAAISGLGLGSLRPFVAEEKVIEWALDAWRRRSGIRGI